MTPSSRSGRWRRASRCTACGGCAAWCSSHGDFPRRSAAGGESRGESFAAAARERERREAFEPFIGAVLCPRLRRSHDEPHLVGGVVRVEPLRKLQPGLDSLNELLSTYAGRNADLSKWCAGAELNTDADLRLQYLGGWGINSTLEDVIYRQMLAFRQLPNDLFTGSPERVDSLLTAIRATGR